MSRIKLLSQLQIHSKYVLRGEIRPALLRTFTARAVASVGVFSLIVTIGQLYGVAGLGAFALAQSLITAISVIARWGMPSALMRFVGRDVTSPKIYAYLQYALRTAGLISIAGMAVIFLLHGVLAVLFQSPALSDLLLTIALAIPPFVLAFILAGFMAAVHKPATACLLQNGSVSLIAALFVVALHWVVPNVGLPIVGVAYTASAFIVFSWGLWSALKWLHANKTEKSAIVAIDRVAFRASSNSFFAGDVAHFMIGVVGVWGAGYWLPVAAVGLYKAGQQLSRLIGVILTVINLVLPPRFARRYHNHDMEGLAQLARRGAVLGLALGAIPLLMCFFFPTVVLRVIGYGFDGASLILRILAVGQFIDLACGSVGHVLNMTGREHLSSKIAWICNAIGIAILLVGTPLFGVVAVALGVATAMSLRKLIGIFFAWRILGIWMLPIPNILRLVGIATKYQLQGGVA